MHICLDTWMPARMPYAKGQPSLTHTTGGQNPAEKEAHTLPPSRAVAASTRYGLSAAWAPVGLPSAWRDTNCSKVAILEAYLRRQTGARAMSVGAQP